MSAATRKPLVMLLTVAVAFLGGCAAARPCEYYELTIPGATSPGRRAEDPKPVTLLVGTLHAPDLYREDQIVYSAAGEEWAPINITFGQSRLRR